MASPCLTMSLSPFLMSLYFLSVIIWVLYNVMRLFFFLLLWCVVVVWNETFCHSLHFFRVCITKHYIKLNLLTPTVAEVYSFWIPSFVAFQYVVCFHPITPTYLSMFVFTVFRNGQNKSAHSPIVPHMSSQASLGIPPDIHVYVLSPCSQGTMSYTVPNYVTFISNWMVLLIHTYPGLDINTL